MQTAIRILLLGLFLAIHAAQAAESPRLVLQITVDQLRGDTAQADSGG
jgi:hypothetical protein